MLLPCVSAPQGRPAQPSLRYLTLIREGAADHGLSEEYRAWLDSLVHYRATAPGQRAGAWLFSALAFATIFPVWGTLALLRRATGMASASNDRLASWTGRYTAAVFAVVHALHELLRPLLGCGLTAPP